ncbi:unnamed protein product, partial [Effrenium voratum]
EKPKAAAEPAAKPAAKPKEAAKPAKPAAKAKAKAKAKSGKAEAKAHVKSALTDESPEKSTGWSKLLDTFATVDKTLRIESVDGYGSLKKRYAQHIVAQRVLLLAVKSLANRLLFLFLFEWFGLSWWDKLESPKLHGSSLGKSW